MVGSQSLTLTSGMESIHNAVLLYAGGQCKLLYAGDQCKLRSINVSKMCRQPYSNIKFT